MRPDLPQVYLDMLYKTLDEKFHEEIYSLFLEGEREKQEYREFYYGKMWEDLNHETGRESLMSLTYATAEIEEFMNRPENLPQYAEQARAHIKSIHAKYAPSNIYDPKTFDYMKELEARRLFARNNYSM